MSEPTDTDRMDWFSGGIDRHLSQCVNGEWCAQDDVIAAWYGATPREAIDAAITAHQQSNRRGDGLEND